MMRNRRKIWFLLLLSAAAALCGGFCAGAGMGAVLGASGQRQYWRMPGEVWRQNCRPETGEQERDRRNKELSEGMGHVVMEQELYAWEKEPHAEARIAVDSQSRYGCTVSIIRDATGGILYNSGLIEPGCYIEKIPLGSDLKKGYYPCTAIWSFYTEEDEYVGEMAWKITVIIR